MNYSIGKFSALTNISPSALRYYEQEGLIAVSRDTAGRRYYTAEDAEWILFIKKLKETGMPIKQIQEYAVLRYQGDSTMARRLEILAQHKTQVVEEKEKWEANLRRLEDKIAVYRQRLSSEKE